MGGDKLSGVIKHTWSSPNAPTGDYNYETYTGVHGSATAGLLPSGVRHATAEDRKEIAKREREGS